MGYLIERRTRVYGRLKKIHCGINRQVRACVIHELFGLEACRIQNVLSNEQRKGGIFVELMKFTFRHKLKMSIRIKKLRDEASM